MATIQDLYLKYTEGVEQNLEEDRYFQYLFEMVQAGENTLQQKNRVLHKVIDERWLTTVEEGIEAIFNIVDKPRRFIDTTEEVVPVALAKKITADSVRHLSQNTQYINTNAAGEIYPTHILNVTTQESYDLYENRFVYHLIQRLFTFVDKRTDVIFWSTGDETCDVMSMESKIDDAYEEISYKVEMTIKNRQSLVENDTDNMELFKRIDRVRRMSRTLRQSSFCDLMSGCSMVRSPIQRTNLMMKDRDYRTCYKLWQFIENYDEVGYTIEERDTALEFDEEYLLQMYGNLITNYTVFKSLLETDPRKMSELASVKRDPVKPKFVHEIKEEFVENRDIPDVEIRRVFVEEVTQAQLDAEAKLEAEKAHTEELEGALAEQEQQLNEYQQQMSELQWQIEALNQQLAAANQIHDETRQELERSEELVSEKETQVSELEKLLDEERVTNKEEQEKLRADARDLEAELRAEAKSVEEKLKAEVKDIEEKLSEKLRRAQEELKTARQDAKEKERLENEARKENKELEKKAAQDKKELEAQMKKQQENLGRKFKEELDKKLAEEKRAAIDKLAKKDKQIKKAEIKAQKALMKAEENSLSKYIVQTLRERSEKKKNEH